MVKMIKNWVTQERKMTFPSNKKIHQLSQTEFSEVLIFSQRRPLAKVIRSSGLCEIRYV